MQFAIIIMYSLLSNKKLMAIAAHHYQIDTYVVSFKKCFIKSFTIPSLAVFSKSTEIIIHTIMFSHSCLLSFDSPINFLRSSKSNRFAIAATFGATASTCLALFANLGNFFPEDSHPWVKGISTL